MASSRISAALTLLLGLVLSLGFSTSKSIFSNKGRGNIRNHYSHTLFNDLQKEITEKCGSNNRKITFSITIGNKTHTNTMEEFTNIPVASHFTFGYNPIISSLYMHARRMPKNGAVKDTIVQLEKCTFDKIEPTTTTAPGTKRHSVTRKHRRRAVNDEHSDDCKQLLGLAELWRIFIAHREGLHKMPCV